MEQEQKRPSASLKIIPRPLPPIPTQTRKAAHTDYAASEPRAPNGGQVHRQGFLSGRSLYLADRPDQVAHRGVPILIPALVQKEIPKETTDQAPTQDEETFPALPALPARDIFPEEPQQIDSETKLLGDFVNPLTEKKIGENHVRESTPQERESDGEFEPMKIVEISGDLIFLSPGGEEINEAENPLVTAQEAGTLSQDAGLESWETWDEDHFPTPPVLHRTREAHGLDTPSKTPPSDAARGRAAAPPQLQTPALLIGNGTTYSPFHSGSAAQQRYLHLSGNPFQSPTPQSGPPLRPHRRWQLPSIPQSQHRRPPPPPPTSHPHPHPHPHLHPHLFAFPLVTPFRPLQYFVQNAMGSGPSNPFKAPASPGKRQPKASAAAQEFSGSLRQSTVAASVGQNDQAHALSQPGAPAVGGFQQGQFLTSAYSPQSFGFHQPIYSLHYTPQPIMQYSAGFALVQSSFSPHQNNASQLQEREKKQRELIHYENAGADYVAKYPDQASSSFLSEMNTVQVPNLMQQQMPRYTKSPSEISFQQMPGAFEPHWSRSFDALPPPSVASDHHSTASSQNRRLAEPQIAPGSERSQSAGFTSQAAFVPAILPAVEGYLGTQVSKQEQQSNEPQHTLNDLSWTRELAEQAEIFARQLQAFGDFSEPFTRPPHGFMERASFSSSEAQDDSQISRPSGGLEPRHEQFAALSQNEAAAPQPGFEESATRLAESAFGPYQAPFSAPNIMLEASENPQTAAEAAQQPRLPVDSTVDDLTMLDLLADDNAVLQPSMESQTAKSVQQNAADAEILNGGGFSREAMEAALQLEISQDVPADLEERFRSIVGSDLNGNEGPTGTRLTRTISPPRIIGGVHHASRHASPHRSIADRRIRSLSPTARVQPPLQHTQPQVQLPILTPPEGVVYMPSPYAMSRPAKAGDETSTEYLNRLLMIAKQDGYMPSHMTLFTDVSEVAFERAFPSFKNRSRASMAYRMVYQGWSAQNMTHVTPRFVPPGLRDWMTMPGSDAWGETIDPREHIPVTSNEGLQPTQTITELSNTDVDVSATIKLEEDSKLAASRLRKGKEPAVNVVADEENQDTSIDNDEEDNVLQYALELSRRESLALVSSSNGAGPVPKESYTQSKLSADAPPFKSPALENVAPTPHKKRRGSRGSGQSRRSSQISTTPKADVVAAAAARSGSTTGTLSRPAVSQTQKPQQKGFAEQAVRRASDGISPALLVVKGNTLAYIPNVTGSVSIDALRNLLGRFGSVVNVDIDRKRRCAFAEFATPTGYRAAVAANPHKIGRETIRVQPRGGNNPSVAATQTAQSIKKPMATPAIDPWPERSLPATKPADMSEVRGEPKDAWPNAPKPAAKPLVTGSTQARDPPKKPLQQPLAKSDTKASLKPTIRAAPKAQKARTTEPSTADEEVKPTTLYEPPKTPPRYCQSVTPATPPTPRTEALVKMQSEVGAQDRRLLSLPEVEEVMENPPIIKKSVKTSKRAVEKAAKKAKALLAMESRAEVAGARLGMGKGVLEQVGVLLEADTDATVTDEETGKKIKKPAAAKKIIVKGIELIPGYEINDNHSKDVYVDRSNLKEKFVISRGQLKEVDLEKKARKDKEIADTQLAHKMRSAEMKSRGKARASSVDDWDEKEEDRMPATESATQSRRGSNTGLGAGGPPVLMALGADFDGWKSTLPRPRPQSSADGRPEPRERPDTAMSTRSNISGTSSSFLAQFPTASLPGVKDPSQFVEPAVIPPPLNRHIIPAQSMSEIIAAEAAIRGDQAEKPAAVAKPVPSSWAQLAAGKSSASASADTGRPGSSEVIELRNRRNSNVGNKNLMSRFTKAPVAIQSIKYDTNEENKRTVYILGIPDSTNLNDISDSVSSGAFGPIYKIEFAIDGDTGLRLAGVLFRDAGSAVPGIHGKVWGAIGYYTALKNACEADYLQEPPLWPWPRDAPIAVFNQEYPEEELMRRMHHDYAVATSDVPQVTRRLCIVNGAKLHATWQEEEMIAFCHASGVKAGNVQKCCVHNFGNSTIVFGSVEDAVLVREKLLQTFGKSKEMSVSFSSCPGENPGPIRYKRDNAYLLHLEKTKGVDVQQEMMEGYQGESRRRRNSKWGA